MDSPKCLIMAAVTRDTTQEKRRGDAIHVDMTSKKKVRMNIYVKVNDGMDSIDSSILFFKEGMCLGFVFIQHDAHVRTHTRVR